MDTLGRAAVEAALQKAKAALGEELELDPRGLPEALALGPPSSAAAPRDGSLVFLQAPEAGAAERFALVSGSLLILPAGTGAGAAEARNVVVFARNPRYAYALIASALYPLAAWRGALTRSIGPSSWAAEDVILGEGVVVEPFVTIGRGSRIGAGSILMRGVSIGPSVTIGEDCLIRENAVVGDLGFGLAFDEGRPPLRLPQVGGVRIGSRVEIGALSSVGSGTIEPTLIEDDAKLSDHVHVAHNCRIGPAAILTVGASVSGSAKVGARAWLAPGAVLRNKVTVGEGAFIGMGSVVVGDVAPGITVAGVPARPFASKDRGL